MYLETPGGSGPAIARRIGKRNCELRRVSTSTEESVLIEQARAGNDLAWDALLRKYRELAVWRSRTYFVPGADSDDVCQEAMFGLYKAIRDYQVDLGVPFASFARLCIDRQICSALRSSTRLKNRHLNRAISIFRDSPEDNGTEGSDSGLAAAAVSSELDPLESVIASENYEDLCQAIPALLSDKETRVLGLLLTGQGYQEIASVLRCPAKSVDNTLQRLRRKVRDYLEERQAAAFEQEAAMACAG